MRRPIDGEGRRYSCISVVPAKAGTQRLSRSTTLDSRIRGNDERWRAGPPALAENSYGCFLPDLTRFTTMQCGAARRCSLQCERTRALIISANDACAASDVARTTKWRGHASTPAQG